MQKPPAERTFVVAVTVLSLAAVGQLVAVVTALAPQLDLEKIGHSIVASRAAAPAAATNPQASNAAADEASNAAVVNDLIAKGQQLEANGDYQGALDVMNQANQLMPGRAGILYGIALAQNALGKTSDAVATLQKLVALPPSQDPADAPYRAQAQAALTQMGGAAAPAAAGPAAAANTAGATTTGNSASMRDDVGIPIGSVMGIVEAHLVDGDPGTKNLRVATKGGGGQQIDSRKFQATVDFYEKDDHDQIVHNDAPRPSEWLSAPVDWANSEPEIFQVKYRLPLADRGDLSPLQYYGYIVAIYYNGELQDERSDQPALLQQYPPPLHKELPAAGNQ
jgi:tetratricopeptide (TPR) repeat protein